MALRQVEIYLPEASRRLRALEEKYEVIDRRDLTMDNGDRLSRILIETENTDALLEWVRDEIDEIEGHRIVISEVAATVPRQDSDEKEEEEEKEEDSDKQEDKLSGEVEGETVKGASRISQEEVYENVKDSIGITRIHRTLVVLSTIVAAGGMIRDSPAVVIGAMMIAPLIGPNIALSLGTTLADWALIKRSLRINIFGLAIALMIATLAGVVLPVDVTVSEIAARTEVNVGDVALALAAGVAGVLSVTRGVATALIGVMVAVALLPPIVAVGLLIGTGMFSGAYGAAMLTVTNIVAINLAGVVTFLLQGIRPMTWYEEKKARRARYVAISLWVFILIVLAILIVVVPPTPV